MATLLYADLGIGDLPPPFEPAYPYERPWEHDRFVEDVRSEGTRRQLIRGGWLDADLEASLEVLAEAPFAVMAVARMDDGLLLARYGWDTGAAAGAVQQEDTIVLHELPPELAVAGIVGLLPLTPAAEGGPITVPSAGNTADGVSPDRRRLAQVFANPVLRAGMFTAVVPGKRGKPSQLPPLTWYDIADPDAGEVRLFATTEPGTDGIPRMTYRPGDNPRMAEALHEMLAPYS